MKYIILDRDGVINEHGADHVRGPDDWVPIRGSLEAIARFNRAGYRVIVITNQSGVARQYYSIESLHAIHRKMRDSLAKFGGHLETVMYCPHGPWEDCNCRLPNPELLHQLETRIKRSLTGVPFVGDKLRVVQAAMAVGAEPIIVESGSGQRTLGTHRGLEQIRRFKNLSAVADSLLEKVE